VVLALVVAALALWRGPALWAMAPAAIALAARLGGWFNAPPLAIGGPISESARLGLMVASLLPLSWLGWRLYRATESVASRVARRV
jgi:hypothetical protein